LYNLPLTWTISILPKPSESSSSINAASTTCWPQKDIQAYAAQQMMTHLLVSCSTADQTIAYQHRYLRAHTANADQIGAQPSQ
jgi:hypothetical protein